jgi:Tol biopolymer transport system component/DNA-binding winged helix-turn-helix (wHTH) protein
MTERNEKLYQFGDFQFDAGEKTLWQDGKNVPLTPKVLEVLSVLIERHGKIVTKDELMDTVWADAFVEESNLKQSIYTLRQTLGTEAIETVPRRGYRFAVPRRQNFSTEPISETLAEPINYKKSILAFGIGAGLLLLIGFLVNNGYLTKPKNAPIENVSFQKLTFSGDVLFPIISPDGKSFAFVREEKLFLQDVNTGSNVRVNVNEHKVFGNLQFSADGESLVFRNESRNNAGGDIFRVSRFGGIAQKLAENVWSGVGFAPDGKKIAFIRFYPNQGEWSLLTKNLESNEEKKLATRKLPESFYRSGFPTWSPDGRKISVVVQEKSNSNLYVIDAESRTEQKIDTPKLTQIEQTVWTPNGSAILLAGRERNRFFQLWRLGYPSGELQRITNDLTIYRNLSLSTDGKNLLAHQQIFYSHLWVASAENLENQSQITFGNLNRDGNTGLTWGSDENLIYASRITGDVDLWSVRLTDGFRQQLTKEAGTNNENPTASTDGKVIYFESNRNGNRNIWAINSNGENPQQITFSETEFQSCPAISPDNNWLYYLQKSPNGTAIWRKSLVDGKSETLTETEKYSPDTFLSLSPDGKMLAFNNLAEKRGEDSDAKLFQIGVMATEPNSEVKLFKIPTARGEVRWSADGKSLDYLENTPESAKIWRMEIAANTEPKLLLTIPKSVLYDFVWSPDGKKLVLARGKQESDVMLLKNFE